MARHQRNATIAVEETIDVLIATEELHRQLDAALADGDIDVNEAKRIQAGAERIAHEAREAVAAAERADLGELIAASYLTAKPLNAHLRERAREIGLPILLPVRDSEPQSAA